MTPEEEREQLIADLAEWCGAEYGRQTEIANKLGVSKQLVSNWITGRRFPSLKNGLALQAFLQEQGKRRRKGRVDGAKK